MKYIIFFLAIVFCFASCKDKTIQQDKELGQQLDTMKCITGFLQLNETTHEYLFDRLNNKEDSVLFGRYLFQNMAFPDDNYLLLNKNAPYNLYISTNITHGIKTMDISKLCSN